MTGRLSSSCHTSLRRPNGIGRSSCRISIPMWEYRVIATANTTATRNRLRMSRTMSSIDMPAA